MQHRIDARDIPHLIGACLLALLLVLTCFAAPYAEAAQSQDSTKSTPTTKTVRIAVGINDALYLDSNDQLAGYSQPLVEQIAWANGWTLEFVEGNWNQSLERLANHEIDLLLPTQKTEERTKTMAFSEFIGGYQSIGLFAKDNDELCLDEYKAFDKKRIALSKGSSNESVLKAYAKKHNFTYTPVYIDSTQEKATALDEGKVDMVALSTLTNMPNAKIVSILDILPFYLCTRSDDTALAAELNAGMRSVLANNPSAYSKSLGDVLTGEGNLSFTREEVEAVKKAPTVRVAVYKESSPLFDVDSQGNQSGIYKSILDRLATKSGLTFEMVPIARDEGLYDALDEGRADFALCTREMHNVYDVDDDYLVSETIMDYSAVEVCSTGFASSTSDSPRFALPKICTYWEQPIKEEYPNATFNYYDTTKDCLVAVQNGDADATMTSTWAYNYQTKNPRFTDLIERDTFERTIPVTFGALKSADPIMLSVLEKSVDRLTDSEKQEAVNANMNLPYDDYSFLDQLYISRYIILLSVFIISVVLIAGSIYLFARRRHIRELKKTNDALATANRIKTDFLALMSHELRTPLNAISGYTDDMQLAIEEAEPDRSRMKKDLDAISRASSYQLSIISDLLDIQRIERGESTLVNVKFKGDEFMQGVSALLEEQAKDKKIDFSMKRLTVTDEIYEADEMRLVQAVANVLHNALKFTEAGGKVSFTSERTFTEDGNALLTFVVSDTGIGMSEEFMKAGLFQPFSMEQTGATAVHDGSGNGLAIAKEYVDLMGGSITCTSKKGKGSTFTISVPVRLVEGANEQESHRTRPLPGGCSGMTALLCEDNMVNQELERNMLEYLGMKVIVADDGIQAREKFEQSEISQIDVVLMDIRMPRCDGLEATRAIRSLDRPDAKTVPILAVSANAYKEDVQASLESGMNAHISKPVSAADLYDGIMRFCKPIDTL